MKAHPAQHEIDRLASLRARADKIAADAAQWIARLDSANESVELARVAFVASLTPEAADTLARAEATCRALAPAVGAIEAAGGPDAFRRNALTTPEVFAVFAAGFEKRRDALEKLKPAARALLARYTAEAVAAGADPRSLVGLNQTRDMRGAHELLNRLDADAQTALVAFNRCQAPDRHAARPFAELFDTLAAPLPVVPSA